MLFIMYARTLSKTFLKRFVYAVIPVKLKNISAEKLMGKIL